MSYLTGIFVDEPLDEEIIGFIQAYSSIIVSWNENLAKDDDIRIKAIALTRYCEGLFTLRETVHLLKEIGQKFREVKDWLPPAFQVSRRYLDCLDEQIKAEGEV